MDPVHQVLFDLVGRFLLRPFVVLPFYWLGWIALRLLTLGRYPPPQSLPHNRLAVAMFAFTVTMIVLTATYGS